jgi:hypothetical protein
MADPPSLVPIYNEIFSSLSLEDKYSNDLWITIVAIAITFIIVIYFFANNIIRSQKANWENNKCSPLHMPFAGVINSADGTNDAEFAKNNFDDCINNLNNSLNADVQKPIKNIFSVFGDMFGVAASILSGFISFVTYLFDMLVKLFMAVLLKIQLVLKENTYVFENILSFINTLSAIITSLFNTIILLIDSVKLIFYMAALSFLVVGVLPSIVAVALAIIILIAIIIICYLLSWIPFMQWIWGALIPAPALTLVTALLYMIIVILLFTIFKKFAIGVLNKTVGD